MSPVSNNAGPSTSLMPIVALAADTPTIELAAPPASIRSVGATVMVAVGAWSTGGGGGGGGGGVGGVGGNRSGVGKIGITLPPEEDPPPAVGVRSVMSIAYCAF